MNSYVRAAGRRFKLSPWFGMPGAALLVPQLPSSTLPSFLVEQLTDLASERGYSSILFQSDTQRSANAMEELGFEIVDSLYVLVRSGDLPIPNSSAAQDIAIRRVRQYSYEDLMKVDHRCFNDFWKQDALMMEDARTSTPRSHFRVAVTTGMGAEELVGFCLYGLGAHAAYLQRIAVDPSHQRKGVGRSLAIEGLRWARRWRARRVSVNTQASNEKALALYLNLGFNLYPERLWILKRDCGG